LVVLTSFAALQFCDADGFSAKAGAPIAIAASASDATARRRVVPLIEIEKVFRDRSMVPSWAGQSGAASRGASRGVSNGAGAYRPPLDVVNADR
jgi:hypothetical protein